jgi:hypothetical protein
VERADQPELMMEPQRHFSVESAAAVARRMAALDDLASMILLEDASQESVADR